jgi:hypothetical protein
LKQVEALPRGFRPPYLDAQVRRLRARLERDAAGYAAAAAGFGALGMPFWVAVAKLEHAELLGGGEEAEALAADARETFELLRATPWLERVAATTGAQQQITA